MCLSFCFRRTNTQVKVQTSVQGTFPTAFGPAWANMRANAAETRFPFGSLVPLWSRQIPYTIAKFFFFEKIVEAFYTHVFTKPKESYDKPTQLGITFASGYLAGIICAVVSHPADSLVSLLGKPENKSKSVMTIANEVGFTKLLLGGLMPRIVMIGTLTGLQWWIYDSFKTVMGMVRTLSLDTQSSQVWTIRTLQETNMFNRLLTLLRFPFPATNQGTTGGAARK